MKKICQNNKGLTLVELIVSVALLGIFCVCCAFLIRPCAEAFTKIQQQTRAQHIADTIVEDLRSELLNATGTIRFTGAATTAAAWDTPFKKPTGDYPLEGSALEICPTDGYYELIDAGYVPETVKTKQGSNPPTDESVVSAAKAATTQGYLHMRYYMLEQPAGGATCYTWQNSTNVGRVYAYADAYPEKFYMKDKVTLQFSVQGYKQHVTSGIYKVNRATAIKVTVRVYEKDADVTSATPVHTQSAILELPNEPILVQMETQFMPKQ